MRKVPQELTQMPKTEWRDRIKKGAPMARPKFFRSKEEEDQWKEKERKRAQFETWERSEYRAIAQRAIKDLALIMNYLPNVSKHPERDYAMIFGDGERLWTMIAACSKAWDKKVAADLARTRAYTSEQRDGLQAALGRAALGYWSKSRLSDKEVRREAVAQLIEKQTEDGVQYYMEVMRDRLAREYEPTEIIVERSAMLLAMSYQERALEKKEQMERTSGPAEETRKGA